MFSGGRNQGKVVAQARRQADAVAAMTGVAVVPLVCVHGGGVTVGWFREPVVDGVRFCSSRGLTKQITKRPQSLSADEAAGIAERLP